MEVEELKPWVRTLIEALIERPDDLEIDEVDDTMGKLFTIRVHESERGKVIGKEGAIANALRVLLRSAGRKIDVRASLKIDADTNFELNKEAR